MKRRRQHIIHSREIGVKIEGGLGNQLFQYAAGLSLARRTGGKLVLYDHTGRYREFLLPRFSIQADIASAPMPESAYFLPEKASWWKRKQKVPVFTEFLSPPELMHLSLPCYIRGYWQSLRYFAAVEEELREHISLDSHYESGNAVKVSGNNSSDTLVNVAVHLRRGDYTHSGHEFKYAQLDLPYYEAARSLIERTVQKPCYFWVFSDSEKDARAVFASWKSTGIWSAGDPVADMAAMSRCDHYIIANSTFSWWAAFLGRKKDSIIIAPREYFHRSLMSGDDGFRYIGKHRYPEGWILM